MAAKHLSGVIQAPSMTSLMSPMSLQVWCGVPEGSEAVGSLARVQLELAAFEAKAVVVVFGLLFRMSHHARS